jgi:uncharacterized protein YceK
MKTLALLLTILFINACTTVTKQIAPTAKVVTDYYCAQPQEARLLLRQEINAAILPNTLVLTCKVDSP